ncbi:DUF262 domain-containing protein [Microbacterium thalli]|uniref:DUF262 domain-containing protein n=1 Tax=Microbacterium thalli TaxID=3027921 RepID=A0ABT5SF32_9MICO|nr:DUF262 domain-containing protein [Microbacterium thalli]MDD7961403.1 DUF262 domain-containing protein [Microbacterium thalli]
MEATLEPRLVMKGEPGKPFVGGEFFVASYQRGYRWGRDEVRRLLDDIRGNAAAAEKRRALPADYYLQPIVVLRRGDGWELVDGQQRLTTLFLITKYVATKFSDARVEYSLTYETREGSRAFLDDLDMTRRDENIDFHHIAEAYDAIVEWFGEQNSAGQAAIDIHSALSKWVFVIWYEAPAGTDPNDLFIRINRDRIPLTDSELIKALVLSNDGAAEGQSSRQQEIAAQWDGFERDLRDEQFWAFLTGKTIKQSTHIDFLFESMTPPAGLKTRPRYWTFGKVLEQVSRSGAAAFWSDVVERHGLLTGWFNDRELYHRVGYLIATGASMVDLIQSSRSLTHTAFRDHLNELTRSRLGLTRSDLSLLRYDHPRDAAKCTDVLLLMNVQTVLGSSDPGSKFSFFAYAQQGWSLEHIHARHSEDLKTEQQRRDWITAHLAEINRTTWETGAREAVEAVIAKMTAHLSLPQTRTDTAGFEDILDRVFALFSAGEDQSDDEAIHGLRNLALLQRDFNSKLNNAVFSLKRERILELDSRGAYILPCTRNVFLKYYTPSAEQQLSIWSPQDQGVYYDKLVETVSDFLRADPVSVAVEAA